MLVFVTKASDDYWYAFKEVSILDDLMKIYHRVIVEKNRYTKPEYFNYWDDFKKEDIPRATSAKYHVTIYDSYIE